MHGAVYAVALLAVLVVVGLIINPIIGFVVIALGVLALAMTWMGGYLRKGRVGAAPGPSGVPTTRDASYEPVSDPRNTPGA